MNTKYLFKAIALVVALSIILPVGLSITKIEAFANPTVHFTDVSEKAWYYNDVMELTKRGLISGYSDRTFKPNAQIRVDEFITILVSAIGENIEPSQSSYWAEGYIRKAKELGIVQDGEFSDFTRYITRGEMARMIVRAGTGKNAEEKGLGLEIPQNYKEYYYLVTDYYSLGSEAQDIGLKIYTSGIISGFSDGSIGLDKNATRAEACAILMKFLEKDRRKIPQLPVDFSNSLTVREFTTQLLKAIGKEATMEYAEEMGYVLPSAEYGSYDKPILKREAAKITAKLMDELVGISALFTSGINGYFVKDNDDTHHLDLIPCNTLIFGYGEKYLKLIEWKKYIGNVKDIRMISDLYQKEMVTLYLAGVIDADKEGDLNPYGFVTKQEGKELINKLGKFSAQGADETLKELLLSIRDVEEKSMPEVEKPSNAELWRSISPYVNKRLYEYPLKLTNSILNIYNTEVKGSVLQRYVPMYRQYFNTRYTFDYRNLDAEAQYYSEYTLTGGKGNYETRVLFYYNPGEPTNGYLDEKGNDRKVKDMIFPDTMLKSEIEKYKKYKVVAQADLITDESLMYVSMNHRCRATLRIIYYPPTDPAYLKQQGLEVGKWYEKDILIDMSAGIDGKEGYKLRWDFSVYTYSDHYDFGPFRLMEILK